MKSIQFFDAGFLKFHRQLKRNNDRAWFQKHKARYETEVKPQLEAFVAALKPEMAKISRHVLVDAAPRGGSIFRIYRDTRFSADKSPYKTHASAHFRHAATRSDVHGPGYYLHLEPGASFAAAGLWRPDAANLAAIRKAIVTDPKGWKKAKGKLEFRGEALKKVPRGYDPEHECAEDLKRKDFIVSVPLTDAQLEAAGFMKTYVATVKKAAPLMAWLARAIGVPF